MRLGAAVFVFLVPAAVAQDLETQRELIRRDQQSDAFKLQLQHSQERLNAPAGDLRRLQQIEARQLGERQRLETTSERQMLEVGRDTPPGLGPLERDRMREERRALSEPGLPPVIVAPDAPRPLPMTEEPVRRP